MAKVIAIAKHFQKLVFETVIRRNYKISVSQALGVPIILYDDTSTGAADYMNWTKELLAK